MNFFQRQQDVRKLSRRLVVLFVFAVVSLVAIIDLITFYLLGLADQPAEFTLNVLMVVTGVLIVGIGLTSIVRTWFLRHGGGGRVAQALGGILVPEDTTDPRLRRLRNVVEEMAIASGTPVPDVYVLPGEEGINAFAAGFTPADAAVAVTHGALERLNRDELQGVIAHEFSHVVNGDMRLNIRLMGVLFGILGVTVVGRILTYTRGDRNPLPLIGIILIIVGYVGVFFGQLIKAAVSRQREYLADASAVQYTRQTAGLVGALKKIGGLETGSKLRNKRSEDVSHMLFGEGVASWFATHPPLAQRIRTLDPTFDPAELAALTERWRNQPPHGLLEDETLGLAPAGTLPPSTTAVPVRPSQVVASIGTAAVPQSPTHQLAGTILESIPAPFLDRARHPETVLPLVFGLLMAEDTQARAAQHKVIADRFGPSVANAAGQEAQALGALHPVLRLPLAQLAFPVLRRRPRQQQDALLACIHALTEADGRVDLHEYCLSQLLHLELYESMHRGSPRLGRRASRKAITQAAATLLAVLADAGQQDRATAEAAYAAGLAQVMPGAALPFAPVPPAALEGGWPVLDALDGPEKQFLVTGIVTVIGHDGVMKVREIELLRTVCALLHCPLPPLADARPEQVTQ
jgi:Zn-dependent protease with chaperone function